MGYPDGSSTNATRHVDLPQDFTATGGVDIRIRWFANLASANAVRWAATTGCVGDSEAISTGPTYNTSSFVNSAYTGTANQRQTTTFTGVSITNCAAGETMFVAISRFGADGGDTLAATAQLVSVSVTIRRAM